MTSRPLRSRLHVPAIGTACATARSRRSQIVTGVEKLKVFVDGEDVCVIYDLKTAPVPTARTCDWYRVRDGKVASVSDRHRRREAQGVRRRRGRVRDL